MIPNPTDKMYWFDVLPIHGKPKPLESLTSYIIRLGESNKITDINTLAALLFSQEYPGLSRAYSDYPPVHLDVFATAAFVTEAEILKTTFFHLGRKFHRPIYPTALGRFLSSSISNELRYCPYCLKEYEYYSLLWRFRCLEGCMEHNCRLLECCGHCGAYISLRKMPLCLGLCPFCMTSLGYCEVSSLDGLSKSRVEARTNDLNFLLLPQAWEDRSASIINGIGQQLFTLRKEIGYTAEKVGALLGTTLNVIGNVERGERRGIQLTTYLKYAEYFSFSLSQLFESVVPYGS